MRPVFPLIFDPFMVRWPQKRRIKEGKDNIWQMEWQPDGSHGAIQAYQDLALTPTTRVKSLPKLTMKREVLGWLTAARIGHGHFAAYHERFQRD